MQDENATMEDEDDGIAMPIFSTLCFKEHDQGDCKARIVPEFIRCNATSLVPMR
jgi:hypothetical protein